MAIQSVVNANVGQAFSPSSNDVATANRAAPADNVAQQPQGPKPEKAASAKDVQQAADEINKALQRLNSSSLEFSVDHDSGQTIVRVVDIATKDVIRQIPNEETLQIAKSIDKLQGLLIRHKA
jgi:flagellar protein FlaG